MLRGKKILLGVTGSIAAYKSAHLIRLLVKQGAVVKVIMTDAAKDFITPVTLSTLSGYPVISDYYINKEEGTWENHVDLGLWADLFIVAPASANTIAKMAEGISDNILLTTYLSARCQVVVCPAMDLDMYKHESTLTNLKTLKDRNNLIIEPASGELASGLVGQGRLEEPEVIVDYITSYFDGMLDLKGQTILITAGPTYEKIDPVRFIGNHSSGKMGFAIAEEAANRGAKVILVSGPVSLKLENQNIRRVDVTTAQEMYDAVHSEFERVSVAILSAAVADFKPTNTVDSKIKKSSDLMTIELESTKDILASLGEIKTESQKLVGFALETDNEIRNAEGKLAKKNLDFIVLNSLKDKGAGFSGDTNKITIIEKGNKPIIFGLKSKSEVASDILNHLKSILE
ncbi:MAG: bifunctional phosphopantothenoylcysteine decarboxylase/phosphopantothenate--cysteine ligase CoaBC [Salibacteraceae bacterium]